MITSDGMKSKSESLRLEVGNQRSNFRNRLDVIGYRG